MARIAINVVMQRLLKARVFIHQKEAVEIAEELKKEYKSAEFILVR